MTFALLSKESPEISQTSCQLDQAAWSNEKRFNLNWLYVLHSYSADLMIMRRDFFAWTEGNGKDHDVESVLCQKKDLNYHF